MCDNNGAVGLTVGVDVGVTVGAVVAVGLVLGLELGRVVAVGEAEGVLFTVGTGEGRHFALYAAS
jgi:hypothetical protein